MKNNVILRKCFRIVNVTNRFYTAMFINKNKTSDLHGNNFSTAIGVKTNDETNLQKTSLYDLHVAHGGKIVNFSGYYLPLQYNNTSISSSHLHTRSNCSIFDVSHMLQTNIYGKHAIEYLESLCVTDIAGMQNNQSALSLFTMETTGGIIDDFIITKISNERLFLISNASQKIIDKQLLSLQLDKFLNDGKDVKIEFLDSSTQSLIAVQGPKTANILQPFITVDLKKLYFMNSAIGSVCGIKNCRITRCGYTGEDGVEISIPSRDVEYVVETLLRNEFIELAGLGARNTLRLEAGLCLYGDDINENTTPVEAGLAWTIGKRRRMEKNYPGSKIIQRQLESKQLNKKRIGIKKIGGPPARTGTAIVGVNDEIIGYVTSGCPSPSLGLNIAMGYVNPSYAKLQETEIRLNIRENLHEANICKMPFIQTKVYTNSASKRK